MLLSAEISPEWAVNPTPHGRVHVETISKIKTSYESSAAQVQSEHVCMYSRGRVAGNGLSKKVVENFKLSNNTSKAYQISIRLRMYMQLGFNLLIRGPGRMF
jgi:hypothetical protein